MNSPLPKKKGVSYKKNQLLSSTNWMSFQIKKEEHMTIFADLSGIDWHLSSKILITRFWK